MRILITGAAGYLGAAITKHLFETGHETIAWCRSLSEHKKQLLSTFASQIIVGDILDNNALKNAKQAKPDVLVHLVSLNHKEAEIDIHRANDINVYATWRLLEEFKATNLSKFIYFSTIQVLGKLETGTIDESYAANPQNVYGLTHHMAENLMKFYKSKASFLPVSLRLANGYGTPVFPDNNCWWLVVNDLCKMAITEKKIVLQSDGSPQRNFIHVKDIARATETIINTPINYIGHDLFHLASSETYTILELALLVKNCFQQKFGEELPIQTPNGFVKTDRETIDITRKYHINTSALNQIGFTTSIGLEQGINELFDYLASSL